MAIGTTAAILGSAALGAAGSIAGSRAQSSAAKKAANASQQATDAAVAEQRRQYDLSRQDMQPWLTTGNSALNTLAGLYGLNTQPGGASAQTYAYLQANPQVKKDIDAGYFGGPGNYDAAVTWNRNEYGNSPAITNPGATNSVGTAQVGQSQQVPTGVTAGGSSLGAFFASPDYQFRQDEQMRALTARNAALGIQDSGAAQKSALQYSGNLASGEFNNYANRLSALAGVGQTAAQNQAAAGQNFANSYGNLLGQNAQNLGSSYATQGGNSANMWGNLAGIGSGLLGRFSSPAAATAPGGDLWGLF